MKHYRHLTERQKQALSHIGKNDGAYNELVGLLTAELDELNKHYERAKETLVMTGEGRPVCLTLKGRIEATANLLELFKASRTGA